MESDLDNPDYITVMPATHNRACVAIMMWSHVDQGYVIRTISEAMQKGAAGHLANSWAAATKLGIR